MIETGPTVVLSMLAAKTLVELVLATLNLKEGRLKRGAVPVAFVGVIKKDEYNKTLDYTASKQRFGILTEIFDAVILAALVLGLLPIVYELLDAFLPRGLGWSALLMVLLMLLLTIPSLPLEWWNQFRIEEKYGFNKSSQGLWISDKFKGALVAIFLSWPLVVSLFWVFDNFPNTWWVWGWGLFFGFQLV